MQMTVDAPAGRDCAGPLRYLSKALLDQSLQGALGDQGPGRQSATISGGGAPSPDLAATPSHTGPRRGRCDSSDCLYCQYAEDCALHAASTPGRLFSLLRKRSNGGGGLGRWPPSAPPHQEVLVHAPTAGVGAARAPSLSSAPDDVPQHAFRRQRTSGLDWADTTATKLQQPAQLPAEDCVAAVANEHGDVSSSLVTLESDEPALMQQQPLSALSASGWRYDDTLFGGFADPAPAQLVQLAKLGLPSHRVSHDMICALEFSHDGRLLATGSMAKQVRLYCLNTLFESQWTGQWNGSSAGGAGSAAANAEQAPDGQWDRVVPDRALVDGSSNDDGSSEEGEEQEENGLARPGLHHRARRLSMDDADALGRRRRWWRHRKRMPPALKQSLAPVAVHRLPGKVSCMVWSHDADGVVVVGDYDGVITQLHVTSGHQVADVDAHAGRRIWGLAASSLQPRLVASASDDGTARLWTGGGLEQCAAVIRPPPLRAGAASRSLCGVDFSSTHPFLLGLASADTNAYLYDIRATAAPLAVLAHHQRPVSYVKFFGPSQLVTASTDASLAMWSLAGVTGASWGGDGGAGWAGGGSGLLAAVPASQPHTEPHPLGLVENPEPRLPAHPAAVLAAPTKVMSGHKNEKNFVGLAVRAEDGLMACGSETSCVFTYHRAWTAPLATLDVYPGRAQRLSVEEGGQGQTALGPSTSRMLRIRSTPQLAATADGGEPLIHGGPVVQPWREDAGSGFGLSAKGMRGVQRPEGPSPFISAVAWQSAAAAIETGLPPLLAAGSSVGDVNLMVLQR